MRFLSFNRCSVWWRPMFETPGTLYNGCFDTFSCTLRETVKRGEKEIWKSGRKREDYSEFNQHKTKFRYKWQCGKSHTTENQACSIYVYMYVYKNTCELHDRKIQRLNAFNSTDTSSHFMLHALVLFVCARCSSLKIALSSSLSLARLSGNDFSIQYRAIPLRCLAPTLHCTMKTTETFF